ncbi:MAG: hypothetical protein EKK48_17205 [Candidatus Melainabacteria bacterium]|nr:MAG: hypothetical protein EKK48_17205 [Candidatus Melainabacteria bacterium]
MNRVLMGLVALTVTVSVQCSQLCLPAQAQWSRGQLGSSIDNLNSQMDTLVKTVQIFLQTRGRWFPQPQGADMQLCYALKDMKDQVAKLDKTKRDSDIPSQIQRINSSASGVLGLLQQTGMDASVMSQWSMVSNSIQQISGGYSINPILNPGTWNPSPGWERPNYNPWSPTLISSSYMAPNSIVATWNDGGRVVNVTSVLDSYVINNGRRTRPAKGDEVHLLQTAYQRAREQNPGFATPINIRQRGNGTFYLQGQPPVRISQVEIVSPKWSPDVTINIIGDHGQQFNVNGTLTNFSPGGFGVNMQSSGIGGAAGSLQASTGAFSRLSSLVGNGSLGGRPFSLQFTQ